MIWAVLLLALAMALVILEVTVPSLGFLSLCAFAAYVFSVVFAFREGVAHGFTFLGLGIILLPVAIALGLRVLPKTFFGRRMILSGPGHGEISHGTGDPTRRNLIGASGTTITDLRPAGTAEIAGRRVDVVSASAFVTRGTTVRVLSVDGTRMVVESVDSETPDQGNET